MWYYIQYHTLNTAYTLGYPRGEEYLSVVSAFQDVPVVVQLVCHRRAIDLHAGRKHHKLVPLAHLDTDATHVCMQEQGNRLG